MFRKRVFLAKSGLQLFLGLLASPAHVLAHVPAHVPVHVLAHALVLYFPKTFGQNTARTPNNEGETCLKQLKMKKKISEKNESD